MGLFSTFQNGGAARDWIRNNIPLNVRTDARNVVSGGVGQKAAGIAGLAGTALNLPEMGVSETGGNSTPYNPDGSLINPGSQNSTTQQPGGAQPAGDGAAQQSAASIPTGGGSGTGNGQGVPSQAIIDQLGDIGKGVIANLDKQYGSVRDYGTNAEKQISDMFDLNSTDLETSHNNDTNQLGVASQRTQDWQAKSLSGLANDVKSLLEAGNTKLGNAGAGSSSATPMYSYAVTKAANSNRADILSKAGQMFQDLNLKAQEIQSNYDSEKRKIVNWKNTTLANLAQEVQSKKEQIDAAKANADASTRQAIVEYESNFTQGVVDQLKTLDLQTNDGMNALDQWYTGWSDNIKNTASTLVDKATPFMADSVNLPTTQQFNPTVETNSAAPGSGMVLPWAATDKKDQTPSAGLFSTTPSPSIA